MEYPVFDLHCDTADRLAWPRIDAETKRIAGTELYDPDGCDPTPYTELASNGCHISLDAMGAIPWGQCFACFVYDEFTPELSQRFFDEVMDHLEHEVAANEDRISFAVHASQIRPALEHGKHVAVRTVENARFFALGRDAVAQTAERGVLMASLSWNARGPLASGCDAPEAGITPAGAEAIRAMEDERMILDVSHLNDVCFADVVRLTTKPFVASHSNSRALCAHPRNLTDAQFAEIRDRGGVVGLNYCPDFLRDDAQTVPPTEDDLCRHIEHWLDLGGENVVALGSDFDGTDLPACISSAAKMPQLQDVFVRRFGADITRKLCYDNAVTFFERRGR